MFKEGVDGFFKVRNQGIQGIQGPRIVPKAKARHFFPTQGNQQVPKVPTIPRVWGTWPVARY